MQSFLKSIAENLSAKIKTGNFKKIKLVVSILIVFLTVFLFYRYLSNHREVINQLSKLTVLFVIKILLLYIVVLGLLIYILKSSLEIVDIRLPLLENLLINCYSFMVNFFMFGQGGPGLRAVYLKSKYNLKIKKFFYLTILYYFYYFLISLSFIVLMWFNNGYAYTIAILALLAVLYLPTLKTNRFINLTNRFKSSSKLFLFTLLQLVVQTIIFGLELGLISKVNFNQILSYSGFANLSLFASITPAGIGIRESVLLLSKKISHISSSTIISASLIDRSIYLIFLLMVLIFLLFFHSSSIIKKLKNIKN